MLAYIPAPWILWGIKHDEALLLYQAIGQIGEPPPSTSLGINRINRDSSCPDFAWTRKHGADKDGVSDFDMFIVF